MYVLYNLFQSGKYILFNLEQQVQDLKEYIRAHHQWNYNLGLQLCRDGGFEANLQSNIYAWHSHS